MHITRLLPAALAVALSTGCAARSTAFTTPEFEACPAGPASRPPSEHLRMVSFNIRSGLSSSIEQVGEALAGLDADVIALQEVDVGVSRTKRVDQAKALADQLGMKFIFAGAIKREGGDYGIALLSRLPITRAEKVNLSASGAYEPRVAIDASVCANGQEVRVIALHADVFPWSSSGNSRMLAKRLEAVVGDTTPVILAGDLNETPGEESPRLFANIGLVDLLKQHSVGATFRGSTRRIDYIMVDKPLELEAVGAGSLDTDVSDHIPVFADFTLR